MKRQLLSALVGSALMGLAGVASAQALQPSAFTGAGVNRLFIAGATAPQGTIINTVQTSASLCNNQWTRLTNVAGGGTGSGLRFIAWGCTIGGTPTVIYYTTTGSSFGVQPVLQGAATPRLDPTSACPNFGTLALTNQQQCNGTVDDAVDVGVSDISPAGFVNTGPDGIAVNNVPTAEDIAADTELAFIAGKTALINALTSDFTPSQLSTVQIRPIQGVIFGVAVSNALATRLGGAINAHNGGPIISKRAVAEIVNQTFGDRGTISNLLGLRGAPLNAALGPSETIKFCKRLPTSGTAAVANIYFRVDGQLGPARPGAANDGVVVEEVLTTGNVRTCLSNASDAGELAIGILSRETGNIPTGAAGFRYSFAQIDGADPDSAAAATPGSANDRRGAITGAYDFIGEATFNVRNGRSAPQTAIINSLVTALTGSAVCTNAGAVVMTDNNPAVRASCETIHSRAGDPFANTQIRE